MNKMTNYPIIIVPGLFGSWGEGIIRDYSHLDFGPAKDVYNPLLSFFIDNGYIPYKNLFVAFYNWRLDNRTSAKRYLVPMIDRAKAITRKDKVILICHSMGGIVARSYIQSKEYKNDVDSLIMLGTPNSGSSTSYLFWEGGEVPYENLNSNFLFKVFWNSYLWHLKKSYKTEELSTLQQYFPSIKQLLPTKLFYGPYIYKKNNYGRRKYIDIEKMKEQNLFLESLNKDVDKLKNRVRNIDQIIGYGYPTNDSIYVRDSRGSKWIDGKPIKINKTMNGDGTVAAKSCRLSGIKEHYIKKDHSELVKYSPNILKETLQLQYINKVSKNEDVYVSLLLENIKNIDMKVGSDNIKGNQIYKYNYITPIPLDKGGYWLIIKRKHIDNLELEVCPESTKETSILISSNRDLRGFYNFKEEKINKKTKIQLI